MRIDPPLSVFIASSATVKAVIYPALIYGFNLLWDRTYEGVIIQSRKVATRYLFKFISGRFSSSYDLGLCESNNYRSDACFCEYWSEGYLCPG